MIAFFRAIETDGRITTTHIAVYAALLRLWSERGHGYPVRLFAREIMVIAKISSPVTYHRVIRELDEYGYIRYTPSYDRNKGSKFILPEGLDNHFDMN